MPSSTAFEFRDIALQLKLCSVAQIEECLGVVENYREAGIIKPLGIVALEKGFLTPKELKKIYRRQGKAEEHLIPGYTLQSRLGEGAVGTIYLARKDSIDRQVAVKIMYPNLCSDPEFLSRFMREAKIAVQLDHSNIVRGLDFGESEGSYFFVMEYVDGQSLREMLFEDKIISEHRACEIILQISYALKYADERNLVHRDIKPDNILVSNSGDAKLCDFGLATITDLKMYDAQDNFIAGSPNYMSPEQTRGLKEVDIRGDFYSLGITFYEIITGSLPYEDNMSISNVARHPLRPIPNPRKKNLGLSPGICQVVLKMTAKKKSERYQISDELIKDLQLLLEGKTPTALSKNRAFGHKPETKLLKHYNLERNKSPKKPSLEISKIEESILQQLILSLHIMDISQFSQCVAIQVDLQLKGVQKSLTNVIVQRGHTTDAHIQNLRLFRDKEGRSLIADYEIVNIIGSGKIAVVYLAREIHTNETVALKIFTPRKSDARIAFARFMREAEATKKLNHANIVKATDFGIIHGLYYLVMDYVSGLSLSHIISKAGRMKEENALLILEQLANALTYAWKRNFVHRDIRPDNVLSDGKMLKICDFGLAKALDGHHELTGEGSIIGTPDFMAPEQFQPGRKIDFRTDIYALGVTFYTMLAGKPPFTSRTDMEQSGRLQLPALEGSGVRVSKATKKLIKKMLAENPDNRYREMDDLLLDIESIQKKISQEIIPYSISKKTIFGIIALVVTFFLFFLLQISYGPANIKTEEKEKLQGLLREAEQRAKKEHSVLEISQILPTDKTRVNVDCILLRGSIKCENLKYVLANGKMADIYRLEENLWHFEIKIQLSIGQNKVLLIASQGSYRKQQQIIIWREALDSTPPKIFLTTPANITSGKKIVFDKKNILLKGYAQDEEMMKLVTIDNQPVPVLVSENKMYFEYLLELENRERTYVIKAIDKEGNQSKYLLKAYYSPRGWFNEKIPQGMRRGEKYGEYLWIKDHSIMVYVPEGEFWYGSRKKSVRVYLSAYYIDKNEVTWKQYREFCKKEKKISPKKPSWPTKKSQPVVNVSIDNVEEYAKWCGKEIPTVSQWTKAFRGGLEIPDWNSPGRYVRLSANPYPFRKYPWGSEEPNAMFQGKKTYRCNYCADDSFLGQASDGYMYPTRGGEFSRWNSPYGCCDMAGNVSEICRDWYDKDYFPVEGDVDPSGPQELKPYKVSLGGSFNSQAKHCRVTCRRRFSISHGNSQTGFRLIKRVIE